MYERPAKLSAPSVLVIWAATRLSLSEKVVWYRDWTLDNGGDRGCYASPEMLGRMLGGSLTAGTIETTRYRLVKLKLHEPVKQGRATVGWLATLPAECRARGTKDVGECAFKLDEHVRRMGIQLAESVELNGDSTHIAQAPGGGVGGVPSKDVVKPQLTSLLSSTEKGVRSNDLNYKKRGGEPEPIGEAVARIVGNR